MPTSNDTPTTAERRHVGHHFAAFADLAIDDADGTLAAARFAFLLTRQAAIPGRDYNHGFNRWFRAVVAGEEAQAIQYAADAVREVEAANHPHAAAIIAIIAIIGRITEHAQWVISLRGSLSENWRASPFVPTGNFKPRAGYCEFIEA